MSAIMLFCYFYPICGYDIHKGKLTAPACGPMLEQTMQMRHVCS